MAHQTEKPNNARPAPDDAIDAEYRKLMKLAAVMFTRQSSNVESAHHWSLTGESGLQTCVELLQ